MQQQQSQELPASRDYDVIIVGGSYSGLAAGMALGRALRKVLIIDSGLPCNRSAPHSHNFLTHDGTSPLEISRIARRQVTSYPTVHLVRGVVMHAFKKNNGFRVELEPGESFHARKLIFATGISDTLPAMPGFAACWGISVLHCPYCHGYEVKNTPTGVFANGEAGFQFTRLLSNWTKDLVLFTNGTSTLTNEQAAALAKNDIQIVQDEMEELVHTSGMLRQLVFKNGAVRSLQVLYAVLPFVQHCPLPQILGCALDDEGYIRVDPTYQTTVPGVFACGDNITRMRTVANAVGTGTSTGMMVNRILVEESFLA